MQRRNVTPTFRDFLELAIQFEPARKRGQAIHNLVSAVRPDLWKRMIADRSIDPIDDDHKITVCLDWLEANWKR